METKFRSTLKLAHMNSWEWDLNTNLLYLINESDLKDMERISPLMAQKSATIDNYPQILFEKNMISNDYMELVKKYEAQIKNGGDKEEVSFRLPFNTTDAQVIWLQFFGVITNNEQKHCAIGYYTDITKQIELAKKAYGFDAIHEAYDNIYEAVLFGLSSDYSNVFWVDLDTEAFKAIRLDEVSQKMIGGILGKITSYKDIISYYIENFVIEEDQDKLKFLLDVSQIDQLLKDRDIYTNEYRSQRFNEVVYCQIKLAKGNIKNGHTLTIGFKNIDKSYRRLLELDYDSLTGLYNRRAFFRQMQKMMNEHPDCSFSLIISDIENFRRINDLYGDKKADELLKYVGNYLDSLTNIIPNSFFGRYSADQFIGLFMSDQKQVTPIDVELFSQGMKQMYENAPISRFKVKFGLYNQIDTSLFPSAILDRALMALRSIKHQYNEMFAIYDHHMEQAYQKEVQILENMKEAIDHNQFKVYYQPKYDCKTGQLVGAEALVRWLHPEYGFMSPGDFIPLFEKNGFITNLDLYVFRKVYEDQKAMQEMNLPIVPVSINASRLDLLHPQFTNNIIDFLKEHQADPSMFHIEVTENIFMEHEDLLSPVLKQLKEFGIEIELDDFGSGYSSLSILNSLPLDVIKLDKGIITDIENHIHVVTAAINLAHVLGYKTTAEGVENIGQANILKRIGCDMIQGYYYAKPMPLKGYMNHLKNNMK